MTTLSNSFHEYWQERAKEAEAQLAEVADLPAKWRDGALEGLFSGPTAFRECANELTAILAKYSK